MLKKLNSPIISTIGTIIGSIVFKSYWEIKICDERHGFVRGMVTKRPILRRRKKYWIKNS